MEFVCERSHHCPWACSSAWSTGSPACLGPACRGGRAHPERATSMEDTSRGHTQHLLSHFTVAPSPQGLQGGWKAQSLRAPRRRCRPWLRRTPAQGPLPWLLVDTKGAAKLGEVRIRAATSLLSLCSAAEDTTSYIFVLVPQFSHSVLRSLCKKKTKKPIDP